MAKNATVTRYGTRYGRTIRERLAAAESGYKGKHKCPHCGYAQMRRVAAGIWECGKCNVKMASRAYDLRKAPDVVARIEEGSDV